MYKNKSQAKTSGTKENTLGGMSLKATGIVRRIDELGRVVIPKEIRRTLRIREGDPLEIFTDREGGVILKKYSPIGELSAYATEFVSALHQTLGNNIAICDKDNVIAAAGPLKKEIVEQKISQELEHLIHTRSHAQLSSQKGNMIPLVQETLSSNVVQLLIAPIVMQGDGIGAVAVFTDRVEAILGEAHEKTCETVAAFLGKQMEQ